MAEAKTKAKKETKTAAADAQPKAKLHRRTMTGVVTSDKMMKTRVVRVERQVRESRYGKFIIKATKFKVHDEHNRSKEGDLVSIIESRPLSKDKRWALQQIVRSASGEVLVKG